MSGRDLIWEQSVFRETVGWKRMAAAATTAPFQCKHSARKMRRSFQQEREFG